MIKKICTDELSFFFATPAFLWQIIFLVLPLSTILFAARYYVNFFSPLFLKIIMRSTILAVATSLSCLIIVYPLVYYVVFYTRTWRNFFLFLLIAPFWASYLILMYAWFFILDNNGLLNNCLRAVGIIKDHLPMINSMGAVFCVMVYCYLPFMIMPLYTALEKIEKRLFEASADLGASDWQTFWRVTVPLSLPGVRTGLLLVLVPTFGEFAIPTLMGGSKYMTIGSLISYYFLVDRDLHTGAAFTIVSGLVLLCLVASICGLCAYFYPQRPFYQKST